MPAFEGITLSHEKQAVVIDIGSAYTKIGFAGEATPRSIIPSEFTCQKTKTLKNVYNCLEDKDLYNTLVDFIHILYFKHVLVSPKDRKVVIVDPLFSPTNFREMLAKVLFCHFEVSSIMFAPTPVFAICPLALNTCLIIDMGHEESIITPVVHGIPILKASDGQPLAARQIHENLSKLLDSDNDQELNLSKRIIEDIKVKACFVTTLERSNQYGEGNPPEAPPSLKYPIKGDSFINISGKTRELACEVLFPRDNDNLSLANIILDAILKCPIDDRVSLASNIFLIGGTSMLTGIKSRLNAELKYLIKQPLYKDKWYWETFKFHSGPAKENFVAWLGCAIAGGTDFINNRSMTRENYYKNPRIPDWVNLIDNSINYKPRSIIDF